MFASGYWVNPNGIIREISYHPIKTILEDPHFYGLTEDKMIYVYKKYNDKNEWEGFATDTIINDLLEKSWIYCYKREDSSKKNWIMKVYKLDKKTRFNIQQLSLYILEKKQLELEETIKIFRTYKNVTTKKSVSQILEGEFF